MRSLAALLLAATMIAVATATEPVACFGRPFDHRGDLWAVRFAPEGTLLGAGSEGVYEWDVATGSTIRASEAPSPRIGKKDFSADGRHLITVLDGSVFVHDRETSHPVGSYELLTDETLLAISPDATCIAVHAAQTDAVVVHELATKRARPLRQAGVPPGSQLYLAPRAESAALLVESTVFLLEGQSEHRLCEEATNLAYSRDGARITVLGGPRLRVFDTHSRRARVDVPMPKYATERPLDDAWFFLPNYTVSRTHLAHVTPSNKLVVLEIESGGVFDVSRVVPRFLAFGDGTLLARDEVTTFEWTLDGTAKAAADVIAISSDSRLRIVDGTLAFTRGDATVHFGQAEGEHPGTFSPDRNKVAVTGGGTWIVSFESRSVRTLLPDDAHDVAWGPELALAQEDKVRIVGPDLEPRLWFPGRVDRVGFTSSGELVTLADHVLTLRARETYEVEARIPADAFAVGPRGLAVARGKQIVLEHEVIDAPSPVVALAFSPDGTKLASSHEDAAIRIWDTSRR